MPKLHFPDIPTQYRFVQPTATTATSTPCRECRQPIDPRRAELGKTTCIECQTDIDRLHPTQHLVAIPYAKGAYQYIHDPRDLFQTNPKQPR